MLCSIGSLLISDVHCFFSSFPDSIPLALHCRGGAAVYYDLKASFTVGTSEVRWACAMFLSECSIIAHNPCSASAKGDLKTYLPYPSDLGSDVLTEW